MHLSNFIINPKSYLHQKNMKSLGWHNTLCEWTLREESSLTQNLINNFSKLCWGTSSSSSWWWRWGWWRWGSWSWRFRTTWNIRDLRNRRRKRRDIRLSSLKQRPNRGGSGSCLTEWIISWWRDISWGWSRWSYHFNRWEGWPGGSFWSWEGGRRWTRGRRKGWKSDSWSRWRSRSQKRWLILSWSLLLLRRWLGCLILTCNRKRKLN